MKDHLIDARLVAAQPSRNTKSSFTTHTMERVRQVAETFQPARRITSTQLIRSLFMKLVHAHTLAFGILAIAAVSIVSFTSYAYAVGSDPVSLIKRWVDGDKVKVEYQGRQFEYGKTRNYSDAAITAYAELNTVQGLAFHATNNMQVPKNGYEHVGDPSKYQYEPVIIGTIESVTPDGVNVRTAYQLGDKMTPSKDVNTLLAIPYAELSFFKKGEPATANSVDIGSTVSIHSARFLKYQTGSNQMAQPVHARFVFALSHDLASLKEASTTGDDYSDQTKTPIFEASWGGLSNVCNNNGADTCDYFSTDKTADKEQGLFGKHQSNFDAISYGEAVGPGQTNPEGIIQRNLQGNISAITPSGIVIKTSSGAEWHFAYNQKLQQKFKATWYDSLKVGDRIYGYFGESIDNLDNRHIATEYTFNLSRY